MSSSCLSQLPLAVGVAPVRAVSRWTFASGVPIFIYFFLKQILLQSSGLFLQDFQTSYTVLDLEKKEGKKKD